MKARGFIDKIETEYVTVDGNAVKYTDLLKIGRKRRMSGFFFWSGTIVGGITAIAALTPQSTPQCNCQTTSEVDTGAVAAEATIGVGAIVMAINTARRNSMKDLTETGLWRLEVVGR